MMKILIISQYYYPEQFQINEITCELVNRGHEVTVITGLPNYPTGIIQKKYRFFKNHNENINGVNVKRCFILGRKNNKINLLMNYISFAISGSLKVILTREKYDIVFCYQLSPVIMAYPAIIYKTIHKKKLLLYCLDLWPESARTYIKNDKGLLYKIITKTSKEIYKQCDNILVTSPSFIDYFSKNIGISKSILNYLPQHANSDYLNLNLSHTKKDFINFLYAGNLGHAQAIQNILYAAIELREMNNFKIHIVGDGSCKTYLESFVKKEHIEDKVLFYGNRPRAEMADIYIMADALLITLQSNNFISNTIPGKLQVYMTTGKPIFGAISGTASDIIKEADCGACVNADDYKGLSLLMKDYICNKNKYEGCGQHAKEYFLNNFTLDLFMNKLEFFLHKMLYI